MRDFDTCQGVLPLCVSTVTNRYHGLYNIIMLLMNGKDHQVLL